MTVAAAALDAIRARLAAATPGPWESDGKIVGWWSGQQPAVRVAWHPDPYTGSPVAMVPPDRGMMGGGSLRPIEDATFIANAPADIATLLARCDALEAALLPLLKARHEQAHNGDILHGGTFEECAICQGALADWGIEQARRGGG